jgi:DNA-binding CsgD family transcriptional regulator
MDLEIANEALPGAVDLIANIRRLDAFQDLLHPLSKVFGCDHGHFSIRRSVVAHDPAARRFMTYAESFIDHYVEIQGWDFDPMFHHLQNSTTAACLSELDWSDERAERFLRRNAAGGLGPSGLLYSVHGPTGLVGMFTAFSTQYPSPWHAWRLQAKAMFGLLGTHLFEKASQLVLFTDAEMAPLSKRETECLEWSARGKTIAETATILGLAQPTVRHLLDDARKKLHATTKSQAVARAQELRLLKS